MLVGTCVEYDIVVLTCGILEIWRDFLVASTDDLGLDEFIVCVVDLLKDM